MVGWGGGGGRGRRVIEVTGERRTPPPTPPPVSRARRRAWARTMPSVCLTRGQDAWRMRTRGSEQRRSRRRRNRYLN